MAFFGVRGKQKLPLTASDSFGDETSRPLLYHFHFHHAHMADD